MVITTHPDMDHQGGNSAIRRSAPAALLACGEADRHLVEDPHCLFRDRYNFLQKEHGVGMGDDIPPDAGSFCRVDIGFRGGERIAIDNGWELEVLHVPGTLARPPGVVRRGPQNCVRQRRRARTRLPQSRTAAWGFR